MYLIETGWKDRVLLNKMRVVYYEHSNAHQGSIKVEGGGFLTS